MTSIRRRRFMGVFAPVGRMALTNYLVHSIIRVALSEDVEVF